MAKKPVRVAVTGAAGQIGYAILPRIASGAMLGPDQPVILHLLEITPALRALDGVHMELDDCAFPLLAGVVKSDDANIAFGDIVRALEHTIADKIVTYDFARLMEGATEVKCSEFASAIVDRL